MIKTPSRILNESAGVFGLSVFDIGSLGYFLLISHAIFKFLGCEYVSFLVSLFAFFVLFQIRLHGRKRTIRDLTKFYLLKNINPKKGLKK